MFNLLNIRLYPILIALAVSLPPLSIVAFDNYFESYKHGLYLTQQERKNTEAKEFLIKTQSQLGNFLLRIEKSLKVTT